jgi:hypothetical protein
MDSAPSPTRKWFVRAPDVLATHGWYNHGSTSAGDPMKVHGQCHCGAIAYEAEVEPGRITVCHCTDCQVQSGSAFRANILAPADGFRLLRGTPKTYLKTADSGARRMHAFCDTCGSPIFACAAENPQAYSLRVGALKERHELGSPGRQIWTRRRFGWLQSLASVPGFDGQP